uniref:unconventional myosin-X-like isoform X2 n=1 Tax=Myxine glutinosa TaxID=7769 RepID=UPI00358EF764
MHPASIKGVEDMSCLVELHEGAILHNLHLRYQQDLIYTFVGSILAAVNPYKVLDGLYKPSVVQQYEQKQLGELPPHIFALASESYCGLWRHRENQCVLISGESGAGKTESTKLILKFLSARSHRAAMHCHQGENTCVETAILESSPIMEAFGNARTVHNHNSSRFGKFIQLNMSEQGTIQGGRIVDYLLEKNRVVRHNPGERNFHIFYALTAGADSTMKESFGLSGSESFHYLNQSGLGQSEMSDDKVIFHTVMRSMQAVGLSNTECHQALRLLSAVLHLGNITFATAGGAQVSCKAAASFAAKLLGMDVEALVEVLTQRSMILRGEEISTPLTVEQAVDSRDSMAMALYAKCFSWFIRKMNNRIRGPTDFNSISILDIFGFENFEANHFEQFNINYANEKLQEYFNKHIFSLEQLEYNREGIHWENIDWLDNAECLDLIEKKLGILALVNEESRFPQGTDSTLLSKLHIEHGGSYLYVKPKVADQHFGIRHYAGKVLYTIEGFLEKNRDTFREDILNFLLQSRDDFIYDLFEHVSRQTACEDSSRLGSKHRKLTVCSQFKDSLHALMTTLSTANPFFVRCIKPNMNKAPESFEPAVVLNQLKYSGMLETVRIRRAGFPVRRPFSEFCCRYKSLLRDMSISMDHQIQSASLLRLYDPSGCQWQLGKSKVFLREPLERQLEQARHLVLEKAATVIQAHVLGYLARTRFRRMKRIAVTLQKNYRAHLWRRRFVRVKLAALTIQRLHRGRAARREFQVLLEKGKMEREEMARKEEERLLEIEKRRQRKQEEERKSWEQQEKERLLWQEIQSFQEFDRAWGTEETTFEPASVPAMGGGHLNEILHLEWCIAELQREKQEREAGLTTAGRHQLGLMRHSGLAEEDNGEQEQHGISSQPTFLADNTAQSWPDSKAEENAQEVREDAKRDQQEEWEMQRIENDALDAARAFAETFDFGTLDGPVRSLADEIFGFSDTILDSSCSGVKQGEQKLEFDFGQPYPEEEDEGFVGGDDGLKESPNPSEGGGTLDQRTSGIRSLEGSEEDETLYLMASSSNPCAGGIPSSQKGQCTARRLSKSIRPLAGVWSDVAFALPPPPLTYLGSDGEESGELSMAPSSPLGASNSSRELRLSFGTYRSTTTYRSTSTGHTSSYEESDEDYDSQCDGEDDHSSRRGSSVYSTVGMPYFHSFLNIKGGMINSWKRRWCVLKDETFMWFRAKQEALRSGWLHKKGGGATLQRRGWRRRWFVLHGTKLLYYDSDSEEKQRGSVDIRAAKDIVDNTGKENGIDVITEERKLHLMAESPEDASDWFSMLCRIRVASDEELAAMHSQKANPKNAVGTIDVGLIDSTCASDNPDRPYSFAIIAAERVLQCEAESAEEMHRWIALLQRSKGDVHVDGQEFIIRGWLHKEAGGSTARGSGVPRLKRRWFMLTHTALECYRSSERRAARLWTLLLDSLCTVTLVSDHAHRHSGYCCIVVHGKRHVYQMYTRMHTEASRWSSAVQTVIDSRPLIETATQQLMQEIRENAGNPDVLEQIVRQNPILRYSQHPLHSPLLPLPYGDAETCAHESLQSTHMRPAHNIPQWPMTPSRQSRGGVRWEKNCYRSLQDEAVWMFSLLRELEEVSDPLPGIRAILQACHDLRPLCNEAYCQLIKQTTRPVQPGSCGTLHLWQALTCLACVFPPSRPVLRYLKTHLRRARDWQSCPELRPFIAQTQEVLRQGRAREYMPCHPELVALMALSELEATVFCHGGGSCRISVGPHTTAGEVVEKLMRGLAMEDSRNSFALFEQRGANGRAIEPRTILADVLAKFEILSESDSADEQECRYQLYFKLYCFLDMSSICSDSVEFAFMFEQAHESVVRGHFPAPADTLQLLAALRLQYSLGDFTRGWTTDPSLEHIYPIGRIKARLASGHSLPSTPSHGNNERKRSLFIDGSLRRSLRAATVWGSGGGGARRKSSTSSTSSSSSSSTSGDGEASTAAELWLQEELQATRDGVTEKWRKLRGTSQQQAMERYMNLVREWPGYGSTLFDVECKQGGFPRELWLAVSSSAVAVYKRGEPRPLETFTYDRILSFGAPHTNSYKIALAERDMMFETAQVVEIAKLMKAYIHSIVSNRFSTRATTDIPDIQHWAS